LTTKIIKELSIQIHLSGLSFCIFNSVSKTIVYIEHRAFETKLTPFDVLKTLKATLSTNPVFSDDFSAVQLIHHNELSALVPKKLYAESNHADYLKFSSKILRTDFIASDVISSNDIINVYVPYVNINNYIFETFGAFTYKHASTLFIDAVLSQTLAIETPKVYIDITADTMLFLALKNGQILLYNHFEFNTPEDFLYYILFTLEQLQLDTETTHLYFSGAINEGDDLYTLAYTYIRHLHFNNAQPLGFSNVTTHKNTHNNFILKHSF
jgi:hypothetical protein